MDVSRMSEGCVRDFSRICEGFLKDVGVCVMILFRVSVRALCLCLYVCLRTFVSSSLSARRCLCLCLCHHLFRSLRPCALLVLLRAVVFLCVLVLACA